MRVKANASRIIMAAGGGNSRKKPVRGQNVRSAGKAIVKFKVIYIFLNKNRLKPSD